MDRTATPNGADCGQPERDLRDSCQHPGMQQPPTVLDGPDAIRVHVELTVPRSECALRSVRLVLCDGSDTVRLHCHVSEVPADLSADDCASALAPFASAMQQLGGGGLVVVVTRPGTAAITDFDRRWFRAAVRVCHEYDARLLGVRVLTPRDHREVVLDDA
jgi:hypothetical protein